MCQVSHSSFDRTSTGGLRADRIRHHFSPCLSHRTDPKNGRAISLRVDLRKDRLQCERVVRSNSTVGTHHLPLAEKRTYTYVKADHEALICRSEQMNMNKSSISSLAEENGEG